MSLQQNNTKLIVVSAPSGAGKTTLVKHLLQNIASLSFSVSATSRNKREGETDGKDYYFLSAESFRQKVDAKQFLEWEEVYPDIYYGTLLSEIDRLSMAGFHVIFDVDVVGGLNIKKHFGGRVLSIFIKAPSLQLLEERLRQRSTDPEASILKRIEKAEWEMGFETAFDTVIINNDLEIAKTEIVEKVQRFINQ
jgi:guanylate kinase